jgi:OmcA/MtrC family decaheme c-type cytochrome
MRIPRSVLVASRYALALAAIAGSVVLLGAARKTNFSVHEKAFYADPALIQYVQPGLVFKVVSAKIASGVVSVDFTVTDPNGAPLDRTGVLTPGAVSTSFLVAYIPKGQAQFVSYISRTVAAAVGNASAVQATGESSTTGTLTAVATGEYIYTFKQTMPSSYDPTLTHRVGIYGSRNLTQWDLGTNYADTTFDFVPAGNTKPVARDVVRTTDCNKCHDSLAAHGGSRKSVELCVMCHTPQTTDPDTMNTVDFKVFIHKLHAGSTLPSVQAGGKYQIIGFNNAVNDWSSVVYPADVRNCQTCHNPKNGAAQTSNWLNKPNQAACGSCHDDVIFQSGKNHVNLPQADDTQCANCHTPQGELPFDASIMGAHTIPTNPANGPGMVLNITKVVNGGAGQKPTVTFTVRDSSGAGIPMSALTASPNRLALVMAGPTSDYGYTKFGSDVTTPGYVSENPVPTAQCASDGTCQYTFTHAVPANAKGTYGIGIEGRRGLVILPGTVKETSTEYGADNKVFFFSVDGTPVQPRRAVVATANCNNCHTRLSVHGENRNQIEMCVLCHNPSENDISVRPNSVVASDKALPPQSVSLPMMIHKIHTGENLADFNQTYIIVGYGGSHNDFSDVRYPTMGPTGTTGDTAKCYMCHVNSSESVLPIGKNQVADTQGLLNPAPATTNACTACHLNTSAFAHAVANTDPKFGESCDVCHGTGAEFEATKMHAGH